MATIHEKINAKNNRLLLYSKHSNWPVVNRVLANRYVFIGKYMPGIMLREKDHFFK